MLLEACKAGTQCCGSLLENRLGLVEPAENGSNTNRTTLYSLPHLTQTMQCPVCAQLLWALFFPTYFGPFPASPENNLQVIYDLLSPGPISVLSLSV